MQIHEITQQRVDEGLWDTVKSAGNKGMALAHYAAGDYSKAANWAQKEVQRQGRDVESETDPTKAWETKHKELEKTPGMTTYITGLAQEWLKSPDAKAPTSATTAPATTAPASEPVFIGGKRLDPKNPNDAKVLAAIQKQGIKEAPEYTTPGGIVVPAGSKSAKVAPTVATTTTASPPSTDYAEKFKKWSDEKLASKVDGVYNTFVTMDEVRHSIPELTKKLDAALQKINSTQNTPLHIAAIQEYLKLASAGVQAVGQQKRYKAVQQRYKPGETSDATNQLGLTDRQAQGIKALAQTPAGKAQVMQFLKDLGIV
jgi:hypothetical protein